MKYQIRRGVFETNSSSMHSISIIGSDNMEQGPFPDALTLTGGKYGWYAPPLMTYQEKLNYIATEFKDDDHALEMLKEIYEEYTGRILLFDIDEDTVYIDHQSTGTVGQYISEGYKDIRDALTELIFNKNKMIIIDNDNH